MVFFLIFALFSDNPEVFLPKYSQTAMLHAAHFQWVVNLWTLSDCAQIVRYPDLKVCLPNAAPCIPQSMSAQWGTVQSPFQISLVPMLCHQARKQFKISLVQVELVLGVCLSYPTPIYAGYRPIKRTSCLSS